MRDDDARSGKSAGPDPGRGGRDDVSASSQHGAVRASGNGDKHLMGAADTAVAAPQPGAVAAHAANTHPIIASDAPSRPARDIDVEGVTALDTGADTEPSREHKSPTDPRDQPDNRTARDAGGDDMGGDDRGGDEDADAASRSKDIQAAKKDTSDADSSATTRDSLIGKTLLGRYEITRKIGQGGMGAVYEAIHKLIGKRVAIKVLLDKYADRHQIVARLEQEARLASSIGHEHIIDITDFGKTEDERTFVVMEYLDGQSLGECLSDGYLPVERIVLISYQIASALHAAHEKGIVHRDIKPENVFLLDRQGGDFVKVVDFGISKSIRSDEEAEDESPRLTQTGMVLGTPLYMSPEQAQGNENLDRRVDIYSLGVIMYEMTTGEVPFRGNNYLSIISQVLNEEPPPPRELRPEIGIELEDIILRALEKEPDERYQTCEEMAADLSILLESYGVTTSRRRITVPRRRRRRRRRRRTGLRILAWVAGIAATFCAIAVTVYVLMSSNPTTVIIERPVRDVPVPVSSGRDNPSGAQKTSDEGLTAHNATVEIVSEPSGAIILLGGRTIGRAPFTWEVPRAIEVVELKARLDGHEITPFSIFPQNDHQKTISVQLKKRKRGNRRIIRTSPPAKKRGNQPKNGKKSGKESGTAAGELEGNPYERPKQNE